MSMESISEHFYIRLVKNKYWVASEGFLIAHHQERRSFPAVIFVL